MSLIMALETYEGIVMTADRLSTLNVKNDLLCTVDCFPKSYNTHKLFITKNGYGISYCGDGKLNNDYLVEQFIQEEICSKDFFQIEPINIASNILNMINPYNANILILFCGYYNNQSFTIEINCKKNDIYNYPDSARLKVIRYGDTSIADAILNKDCFYYGYSTYRTQDAINLLVCTNEVVAKYQQFQEVLQTVSTECDVLILFNNGTHRWLNRNDLHI